MGLIKEGQQAISIRLQERMDYQKRSPIIVDKFVSILKSTPLINKDKNWSSSDVTTIKQFILETAPFVHPKVDQHFWSHLILASIYAKKIAKEIGDSHIVGQSEGQALLLLHDIGRLVIPHRYLRNDFATDSILCRSGVDDKFKSKLPPMLRILAFRSRFGKPIESIKDMKYALRVVDYSDNLGKMVGGTLFTVEETQKYSTKRLEDYEMIWETEALGRKAMVEGKSPLTNNLISQESQWLTDKYGINLQNLRESVWEEYQSPENQVWLSKVISAQQSGITKISY